MMALEPFTWGQGGAKLTATDVARNRKVAEALANRVRNPQNMWEGIQSAVGDIGGALLNYSADQTEARETDAASRRMDQAIAASTPEALLMATTDPWMPPQNAAVLQALYQRELALQDRKAAWDREDDLLETESGGQYGQTIIPGLDEATGALVPMRADPRGGLSIAAMPEGITYAPDALAGARAAGTIDGKTMANARAALPAAEQTVQITLDAIDTLRNDKQGQSEMFNGFNRYFGSTKGTPMANFEVNLNQASGQAFMQARQMLKGGGQITDFEGRRAEAAFSRLSDAANQGDLPTFLAALDDFEMAVTEGYRKLQAVANGTYQPTTSLPGGGNGSPDPLNLFGGQ